MWRGSVHVLDACLSRRVPGKWNALSHEPVPAVGQLLHSRLASWEAGVGLHGPGAVDQMPFHPSHLFTSLRTYQIRSASPCETDDTMT